MKEKTNVKASPDAAGFFAAARSSWRENENERRKQLKNLSLTDHIAKAENLADSDTPAFDREEVIDKLVALGFDDAVLKDAAPTDELLAEMLRVVGMTKDEGRQLDDSEARAFAERLIDKRLQPTIRKLHQLEVAAVAKFYDQNRNAFSRMGTTKDTFVQGFKHSGMTADEYCK